MFRVSATAGRDLMGETKGLHSLRSWLVPDLAYPHKPADWDDYTAALRAKLTEPGRMDDS